jgi:hypothetical protein
MAKHSFYSPYFPKSIFGVLFLTPYLLSALILVALLPLNSNGGIPGASQYSLANTTLRQKAGINLAKSYTGVPDTLEIYAFKVQFAYEDPDNSLTTGRGYFDSDEDTASANYSLDPAGSRASSQYWQKHFAYAHNYFQAVSGGKVAIESHIFPKTSDAYQLDKGIIEYNRTQKRKEEKQAEFDEARAQDYLQFVWDAVQQAAKTTDSPFNDSLPQSPNRHRVYMIIHAGASRLVDGGTMGSMGADTPGDFMDLFISQDAFSYLEGTDKAADANGIVLQPAGTNSARLDTLKEIMVVSETASQDGLNWGINGTIVNQIARQIGMPATYDVVKGFSRLGYFDVMDFAGYNAQNGFLPVAPSAWLLEYMGWANVQELRPGPNNQLTIPVQAAQYDSNGFTLPTVYKVPLSTKEYLLIENRQRSVHPQGMVTLTTDRGQITVKADSLHLLFLDSICTDGSCKVNTQKAKGIIENISSIDAGLPASGLAVWHVNEWFIEQYLRFGFINAWQGDTLQDHQFGVALVESDGVLTIGKEFKNQLGQPAFDYGGGSDLLPHIQEKKQNGSVTKDTIVEINAYGYGNTNTTNSGKTHIRLRAKIPEKSQTERTVSSFSGDTIQTFRTPAIELTVQWGDITLPDSRWPMRIAPGHGPASLSFYPNPFTLPQDSIFNSLLFVHNAAGNQYGISVFTPTGDSTFGDFSKISGINGDSLSFDNRYPRAKTLIPTPRQDDSVAWYASHFIQKHSAPVLHSSLLGSTNPSTPSTPSTNLLLHTLQNGWVFLSHLQADTTYTSTPILQASQAPIQAPITTDSLAAVLFTDSLYILATLPTQPDTMIIQQSLELSFTAHSMAWCTHSSEQYIFMVDNQANVHRYSLSTQSMQSINAPTMPKNRLAQFWQVVCADFDRNGEDDVFVLGSLGNGYFYFDATQASMDSIVGGGDLQNAWLSFTRGALVAGEQSAVHDQSPLAIGDVNDDGYPDIVFRGLDMLWAIDYQGVSLQGFPVHYNKGLSQGHLRGVGPSGMSGSSPIIADMNGDGVQDILVSTSAGLIYAINGSGAFLQQAQSPLPSTQSGELRTPASDWPLAVNQYPYYDSALVTTTHIYLHNTTQNPNLTNSSTPPELYALTHNHLQAWTLPLATNVQNAHWPVPFGNSNRTNSFNAALLKTPTQQPVKKEITEFFLFPNPLRHTPAKARISVGAPAKEAYLELYDLGGFLATRVSLGALTQGRNQIENINLDPLGSDVYAARLIVHFEGNKKIAWDRIGVIR